MFHFLSLFCVALFPYAQNAKEQTIRFAPAVDGGHSSIAHVPSAKIRFTDGTEIFIDDDDA